MNNNISKKQITIYLTVAFVLAYILQIIGSIFNNKGTQTGILIFQGCLALAMFAPLTGLLIARIPFKGMGWIPHLKGKVRWIFYSMWIPAVLCVAGAIVYFVIFPNHFDPNFTLLKENMGDEAMKQLSEQGLSFEMMIGITCLMSLTFVPFTNTLTAIGEEVGWRGALYPYLKDRFGKTKGRVIGGIIWGAWHWPCIIITNYNYSEGYIGAPFLAPVAFVIGTVSFGIIIDYAYEKTETIWVPALVHGAINGWTIYQHIVSPEYTEYSVLGPSAFGLIGVIPALIYAIIICIRSSREEAHDN